MATKTFKVKPCHDSTFKGIECLEMENQYGFQRIPHDFRPSSRIWINKIEAEILFETFTLAYQSFNKNMVETYEGRLKLKESELQAELTKQAEENFIKTGWMCSECGSIFSRLSDELNKEDAENCCASDVFKEATKVIIQKYLSEKRE